LANSGPVVLQWTDRHSHTGAAGLFMAALVVGRLPIYVVPALQTAIMPNLAEVIASGRHAVFKRAVRLMSLASVALIVVGSIAAYLLGPWAVGIMFGAGFSVSALSITVLTCASLFMVFANALTSAALALHHQALSGLGWLSGAGIFCGAVAAIDSFRVGVEVGYLAGAIAVVVAHAAILTLLSPGTRPAIEP
jgi:O-antigen/teichoic acid export membrane protein